MPLDPREPYRPPVRIRLVLPDLSRLPWLRGIEEQLVTRTTVRRRRIALPKLVPTRRAPLDEAARARGRVTNARMARHELVAAAIFGAVGLAITFGLMVWSGAIDFGTRP